MSTNVGRYIGQFSPLIALSVGLLSGAVLMLASGVNPLVAYRDSFTILLQSPFKLGDIVVYAMPIMIIGVGLALAFKANFWNIGAEGQLWMGGLFATLVALNLNTSAPIYFILMLLAGFGGGCIWGLLPALLKTRYGTSEILVSMLMCPIAVLIVEFLLAGPLRDPVFLFNQTPLIPEAARFSIIVPGTRITVGILVALVCAVLAYVILNKTTLGYRIKCVGYGPKVAQTTGINVPKTLLSTMVISSGLSGIAGMTLVSGIHHRLLRGFSPGGGSFVGFWGYGYIAIAAALLAKNNPLATIGTSLLFGFLTALGYLMEAAAGVSRFVMIFVEAIVIICAVWLYKIR